MLFHKNTMQQEASKPSTKMNTSWIKKGIFTIIVIAFLAIIFVPEAFQIGGFLQRVSTNWQELQFAYEHPQFIKAIRLQYATEQKQLETSFLQRQQSPQDKLLNAVTTQLNSKN